MAAVGTTDVVVWEWLNEFGRWRPYDATVSDFIEKNKQNGNNLYLGNTDPNLAMYVLDLQNMQQIRQDTDGTRQRAYALRTRKGKATENPMSDQVTRANARCVRRMVYNTTHPIACGVAWQWSGDHRHDWHTYDMEVMAILEDAFSRKASILDLSMTSCKLPYTLDLKHLQQVRNETGFARKIRRMQLVTPYPKDNSNNKTPSLVTPLMNGIPVPGLPGGKKHAHSDSSADSSPDGNPPINHLKHQHKKKSTGMGRGSLKSLAVSSVGAGSSASYLQPSPSTSSGSASMMSASVLSASVSQSSSSTSFGSQGPPTLRTGHVKMFGSRLSPAVTGITNLFVSPVVPVVISTPPVPVFDPPTLSKSDLRPVPGVGHPKKPKKKSKTNKYKAKSPEDVLKKYVSKVKKPPNDEDCCICFEKLSAKSGYDEEETSVVQKLDKCHHMFHRSCLHAMYDSGHKDGSLQCPTCKTIYGEKYGNCPPGHMDYHVIPHSLPSYTDCGTIRIIYDIPPGMQGPEHPNPNRPYSARGFPRHCYLPDNEKGRKVLKLLVTSWERRLTFTVGTSSTTGEGGTVTWNEIHHKTEFGTNQTGHGYPDPNYLDNVILELAAQGVTDD